MDPARAVRLNAAIASARLLFEPLVAAHAEPLFGPLQAEAIYRWISATPPASVEALRQRWARCESRLSPAGDEAWLNWAVRRSSDGAYVGRVDVVVVGADVATNVGYVFFPTYWGHGYATEAVSAVADHLGRQGVAELWATVTVGNHASVRVLEKAGFKQTRILPDNDTIRGLKHDDVELVRRA